MALLNLTKYLWKVKLTIYNLLGQEVRTLVDEMEEAGYQQVEFSAGSLPSGVYYYKTTAGTFTDIRKMTLTSDPGAGPFGGASGRKI